MLRECERDRLRIGIDAGRRIHDFAIGGGDAGAGEAQVRSIQGHACLWLEQNHLYSDFAPEAEVVSIWRYRNGVVPGPCLYGSLRCHVAHAGSGGKKYYHHGWAVQFGRGAVRGKEGVEL